MTSITTTAPVTTTRTRRRPVQTGTLLNLSVAAGRSLPSWRPCRLSAGMASTCADTR
jgi:hypothetical protein